MLCALTLFFSVQVECKTEMSDLFKVFNKIMNQMKCISKLLLFCLIGGINKEVDPVKGDSIVRSYAA